MKHKEAFHVSLDKCISAPGFFDRFYERIMAVSPEVGELLDEAEKGIEEQKRLLKASLYASGLTSSTYVGEANRHLEAVGRWHREIGFRPNHYNLWLYCLIETVAEFDDGFDEQTERLWIEVMSEAVETLRAAGRGEDM